MATKRVVDVSSEYAGDALRPARDAEIAHIKNRAQLLRVGPLESRVDRLLDRLGVARNRALPLSGLTAARSTAKRLR